MEFTTFVHCCVGDGSLKKNPFGRFFTGGRGKKHPSFLPHCRQRLLLLFLSLPSVSF